jgi:hypothetical protein
MIHNQEFIEKIRSFNRFFTNIIGLLNRHFLDGPFSLTEGRVLYEIYHTGDCSAKKIRANIVIDEGYLSRIIDTRILRRQINEKENGRQMTPGDRIALHYLICPIRIIPSNGYGCRLQNGFRFGQDTVKTASIVIFCN